MISQLGKYQVINEIGSGNISTVYSVRSNKMPEAAAKVIDLRFKSAADVCSGLQEIRILSSIGDHPTIVKMTEAFVEEDKQLLWYILLTQYHTRKVYGWDFARLYRSQKGSKQSNQRTENLETDGPGLDGLARVSKLRCRALRLETVQYSGE